MKNHQLPFKSSQGEIRSSLYHGNPAPACKRYSKNTSWALENGTHKIPISPYKKNTMNWGTLRKKNMGGISIHLMSAHKKDAQKSFGGWPVVVVSASRPHGFERFQRLSIPTGCQVSSNMCGTWTYLEKPEEVEKRPWISSAQTFSKLQFFKVRLSHVFLMGFFLLSPPSLVGWDELFFVHVSGNKPNTSLLEHAVCSSCPFQWPAANNMHQTVDSLCQKTYIGSGWGFPSRTPDNPNIPILAKLR